MANTPPIVPPLGPVTTGPSAVGQRAHPPLPQLPAGSILQGTVTGQDSSGHSIIKTDTLRLVLNTQYPLPKGAQVSVQLDQTLAGHLQKTTPQTVHIVSVDGKAALPQPVNQANPQAEQVRPVGTLLDIMNRSDVPKSGAGDVPPPPNQPAAQAAQRGVATEVNLSEALRAAAVLLRPSVAPQAAAALQQLAQQVQTPLPNPLLALRPGLQLQVQIVQPSATAASAAAPSPAAPPAPPQAPVSGSAAPTPSLAAPSPSTSTQGVPPSSAQVQGGYASYAKQVPAMMPGSPPPQGGAGSMPPSLAPAQVPAGGASPPAASTATPVPVQPQPLSSATPVQVPQHLTPQVVEQILVRAEAQPLPQGQLSAVVMGREPSGQMIVQTRLGMFSVPQMQAEPSLQPGNVMTWQVRQVTLPQAGAEALPLPAGTSALSAAMQMTSEWSALSELATALQSMQGAAVAHMQRAIPHVGSHMGAGLMLFMTMLRKGDVADWLGKDVLNQLEQMGKTDLLPRLSADIGAMRSLFADQPPGNWQAMFFPVMVDKQLQHAQMFVKPDEQGNKQQGGGGTRFVVELELSNLGPMQIDGFVRKREAGTRFDLVMRSLSDLPDAMKTDIYAIFDNAQQVAGFKGSLQFRHVHEFPVHPLEEMQAQGGDTGGGVVA
jgi:predicted RecA/RadA family phage recombinase